MSTPSLPFYAPQALHDTYLKSLDLAQTNGIINADEKERLGSLLQDDAGAKAVYAYYPVLSRDHYRPVHWVAGLILKLDQAPASAVFLFTALGRFERFATKSALREALQLKLDGRQGSDELLRFCPVDVRFYLTQTGSLSLVTRQVSGPVMAGVSLAIESYLRSCQAQTLQALVELPTLRSVLDGRVSDAVMNEFAGPFTDVLKLQVRSTRLGGSALTEGDVNTASLSAIALDYYLQGGFEAHYRREYLGLPEAVASLSPSDIERRFERVLRQASEGLADSMRGALRNAWWPASRPQLALHDYCVARQADVFYHQTVQALHEQKVTAAQFAQLQHVLSGTYKDVQAQVARLAVFDPDRGEVGLSGVFCIFFPGLNSPVFLFGGAEGLQQFETRARLKDAILSPLRAPALYDSIARHAALDQHALLADMREMSLSVENIDTDVFSDCVQGIHKKQASDFNFLLKESKARRIALAGVDHALDVRELVDQGLLALNPPERWSSRFMPHTHELTLTPRSQGGQADLLSVKLPRLEAQVDELLRDWPTAKTTATARLQTLLVSHGHAPSDVHRLEVEVFDQAPQPGVVPVRSLSLVEALLERVTGYQPLPQNPDLIHVVLASQTSAELKPTGLLAATQLLTLLEQASPSFVQLMVQRQWAFFHAPYPGQSPDALVDRLSTLRMVMLRAELRLLGLENHLQATDRAVVGVVLGNPISDQRPALDQFVPDVFAPSVSFNGSASLLDITNCLLFTQRGGLESDNAGRAVFWGPAWGFESFESVDACKAMLEARLMDKGLRWGLLAHVNASEQARVVSYLEGTSLWHPAGQNDWFYFERFEEDFTRQSQNTVINQLLADTRHVCSLAVKTPLSAQGFENSFKSLLLAGRAGVQVARVSEMARLQLFKASLPEWLKSASAADQKAYADVLQRYQRSTEAVQSYLHNIPQLSVYSNALLTVRLDLDFPGANLNPEAIEIAIDTYLAAPVPLGSTPSFLPAANTHSVQSLTQFALSGLHLINEGVMFVRLREGGALPIALNARYVRRLVRELDLGTQYQGLIKTMLAPGREGVALRQQQFAEQLAVQMLEQAMRQKLQDPEFETAYRYICHVVSMPDGAAREALDQVCITVRPFELIEEPGADPDRVRGVYIIGPVEPQSGPQVLWITYSERFTFKAYANDAALLSDLGVNTELQADILQRIAPYTRKVYDHGGFVEPHLARYGDSSLNWLLLKALPPTLARTPIAGNLFRVMYKDNYEALLTMAAAQTETTAQADWEAFKYLMSLVITSALMFLPARLNIPLVVWQSLGWLTQGVEAAKKGDWGESVAEFATLLSLCASGYGVSRPPLASHAPVEPVIEPVRLTAQQRAGLEPFQVHDVTLLDLRTEPQTQLFSHPKTKLHYVHLDGCLFRVQAWRDRWRIDIGEGRDGPLIKLNARKLWELDPNEPLLGGGPVMSTTAALADRITHEIQATGMGSIQRQFPDKALAIRDAHAQAVTYLERCQNALHTLNEPGADNAAHRELIKDFFDVPNLEAHLLERLNHTIEPMLTRFLHPDLSPLTSRRYVVCRSRFNDKAVAWIHRWDTDKRVFLSERFFTTLFDTPQALSHPYLKPTDPPFAVNAHYRASFLLHEVSHGVLNTEDINYLNPGFPYDDLLDDTSEFGNQLRSFNQIIQECHSPHLQPEYLFQQFDVEKHTWADIPSNPGKARVKAITGVQTLAQARSIFTDDPVKRVELMLANADTVVLLITRLGRVQPVVPEVSTPV
ncbi:MULTISPECIES: dermonecrotic toxin domain-containing protein [unclassified Pseudomonas]|uniref:dermonecrotic toxin domain-containing protein n=1 Tax=unclassified Pseudomonas TaxID=196821 RepID=UPI001296EB42|nr:MULTISPECIES: DUF6543 domain-containing protein [unclassified Pseudomonas]MQT44212.1 hypothetical protein [Pseudomonas sp. FSL R10-0765]MQT55274.1 hypothetical protein [Pseudomonas sp. FSL R10-2398]MQU01556.1 hypothetical protein [Pseudomonas sp. FSL R10-2245]MQU13774.1 hypothetical protein [Pseudomonas sp. FSL R10-2189]MQU39175.1 hypothetical protein [Pseudomonas sp. FSL R10-2172]